MYVYVVQDQGRRQQSQVVSIHADAWDAIEAARFEIGDDANKAANNTPVRYVPRDEHEEGVIFLGQHGTGGALVEVRRVAVIEASDATTSAHRHA